MGKWIWHSKCETKAMPTKINVWKHNLTIKSSHSMTYKLENPSFTGKRYKPSSRKRAYETWKAIWKYIFKRRTWSQSHNERTNDRSCHRASTYKVHNPIEDIE